MKIVKKCFIFVFLFIGISLVSFSTKNATQIEASGLSFAEDLMDNPYNSPDCNFLLGVIPRDLLDVPGFHMDVVGNKGYMLYNEVIDRNWNAAPDIQSTILDFMIASTSDDEGGTISVVPGNKYVYYVWPRDKVVSYDYSYTDYYNDFGNLPFLLAPHYENYTNGPEYPFYHEIYLALSSDVQIDLHMKNANGLNPGDTGYNSNSDYGLFITETVQQQVNSKIIFREGNYSEPIINSFVFDELTSVGGELLEAYEIVDDFDEIMGYYELAKDFYDLGQFVADNPIMIHDDMGNLYELTPAMAEAYGLDPDAILALQQLNLADPEAPDYEEIVASLLKRALDSVLYSIPGVKYLWLVFDLNTQSFYPDYLDFAADTGHIHLKKKTFNPAYKVRNTTPENIVNDNSKILVSNGSFARLKYKTAHTGTVNFEMDVQANVKVTGGYLDSAQTQQFIPQKTVQTTINVTENRYLGELTRGLTFLNELNSMSENQYYKVVPNFTGEITFDTLNEWDYMNIKLYNSNGIEVPLYYRSQTNTMYGYVNYGSLYYVMIQNSSSSIYYEMLSLRYYRTNPFTGFVYTPAHVEGYGQNQIWYEHKQTTSKTTYFSYTNNQYTDITIKIYDENFNLLRSSSTLSELGYYFIANRKYFIVFESKSVFGDDSYFDYIFKMRSITGSC